MDHEKLVFLIAGKIGSGKDTAAKFISGQCDLYLRTTEVCNFADSLKKAAMVVFGLTNEQVYTQEGKAGVVPEFGLTVREILQKLGTEVCRNIHPDVFAKAAARAAESSSADVIVMPDWRFLNEAEALQERFSRVRLINIVRPCCGGSGHVSENSLDGFTCFDYVVNNDGSLYALQKRISEIVAKELSEEVPCTETAIKSPY